MKNITLGPDNDSPELTELERAVFELAIAGHPHYEQFVKQIDQARVESRTGSGVGFMTKLTMPADAQAANATAAVPSILADHPELPAGAEFVLDIRAGRIHCLEAFSFEGMWPRDEALFRLRVAA